MVNHTNSQNQWEKYHFSIDKRTQKYYTNNKEGEVIPMKSMTNLRKFKGFTLVELIVVMAIMVIIASIGSLGVTTFVRNARLETLNDKAQMVFTGFQNMLIQCEIKQDDSLFFRVDETGHTDKDVYAAIVYFHIASSGNGATYERQRVGNLIEVLNVYTDGGVKHGDAYDRNDGNAARKAAYEKLESAILSYIPEVADGTYAVYINYENYTVDGVVCRDLVNGVDPTIVQDNLLKHTGEHGYYYFGLNNKTEQKDRNARQADYGVYPYGNEVNVTFS